MRKAGLIAVREKKKKKKRSSIAYNFRISKANATFGSINKNLASWSFPGGSAVKILSANAGDTGLILGL